MNQIEQFKRTRAYTRDDYALLAAFIGEHERMVTTPNVLTEVSNLLGQLTGPLRIRALLTLGALAGALHESYLPSKHLVLDPHFPSLGLTDTSILHSLEGGVTVLTDDLQLYLQLAAQGSEVINFNHLRSGSWG
ncbi:MAG TPA: hypothetical protein VGB24_03160 [Longimicrobium sp.]|uniref:hypothetical protein n=1 Tax=Longimicrobium sp. TaxID=2029185 RepID=UPI002ED9DD31